jgi:hypothetical protein
VAIHPSNSCKQLLDFLLALQVVMQPDSPARQKLAQLPQPALEALLDIYELQAASKNTVIAAVTYWLGQSGRAQEVTKEQKQRLAYKIRLSRATSWYLLRILLEEGHWLSNTLSSEQKLVLTAAAHNPEGWEDLQANCREEVMCTSLFGASDLVGVSWWEEERPGSSVTKAEVIVEVSPGSLWEGCGAGARKYSLGHFYNGYRWSMYVTLRAEEAGKEIGGFQLGAYIVHNNKKAKPVAFSAHIEVVGVAQRDTKRKQLGYKVRCKNVRGFANLLGTTYTSLEDAAAKLAPFIHPDGKLHIKGTISRVH